jgi:hypothetical protein
MSKQTLSGWKEDDKNISVILITAHLDDFRLAYTLNRYCLTQFVNISNLPKTSQAKQNQSFTKFVSAQSSTISRCYLVHNQYVIKNSTSTSANLFNNLETVKLPLIKSYPKWPYILIHSSESHQELLLRVRLVPNIIAHQVVDFQTLSNNDQNIIYNIYNED